jgi:hypothetical protein
MQQREPGRLYPPVHRPGFLLEGYGAELGNEWKDENEKDFPRWLLWLCIIFVIGVVIAWKVGWLH